MWTRNRETAVGVGQRRKLQKKQYFRPATTKALPLLHRRNKFPSRRDRVCLSSSGVATGRFPVRPKSSKFARRNMNEECNEDVFRLEHYAPEDFEQCICQKYSGTKVCYVLFLRILDFYFLALNVWSIVYSLTPPRKVSYFIYFDFWTRVLYNILSVFHLHGVGRNWRVIDDYYNDEYLDYMPSDYKLYWVLYSTFLPAILLSFVVFWAQLYTSETPIHQIVLTAISTALAIFHFFLIAFPLRMMHFFYFIIFYTIYILFTFIYQETANGGVNKSTPIYKNLDWKQPGNAVLIAFAGCAIGVALYLLFCLISMLKFWVRDKYDD